MEILGIVIIVILLIMMYALIKNHSRLNDLTEKINNTHGVDSLAKRIQEADESNRKSFERLAGTLGELSKATEQLQEVGKNVSDLEDLLKPPKIRGGLGETMLGQLLAQILPDQYYQLQHTFKSGKRVDAVIMIGDRMVPVDSKFPLEQFNRLINTEDESSNRKERRAFIKTIKNHINDIAEKYILPDEGTYDFALMYIPAENVYYETIIKDEHGNELYPYAIDKRVIPVSPSSFYAYLQVIVYGLKGMQIEERAQAIMDLLSRLQSDEEKFRDEFDIIGTHLKNMRNKYEQAERRLNIFEDKLQLVSGQQDVPELPPKDDTA